MMEEIEVISPLADLPLRRSKVAVVDFETTWENNEDRTQHPVSIAVVHCDLGVVGSEKVVFYETIRPSVEISEEATAIHGITNDDVRNSPFMEELVQDLRCLLDGRLLAAYNIPFDVPLLQRYIPEIPFGTLDPLVWARVVDRKKNGKSLVKVAERRGFKFAAHRADEDALVTARLMPRLLAELKSVKGFDPVTLDSIYLLWLYTKVEALKWEKWLEGHAKGKVDMAWHKLLGA